MNGRLNRQGSIKLLFSLALVVAVAFVLISFGRPYYRYYTLGHYTSDDLLMEVGDVPKIRQDVLKRAAELGVPLDPNNLEVTVTEAKTVKVKATWSEVVDFWGYYTKQLDFTMDEEY
jgi:hypothetical protein